MAYYNKNSSTSSNGGVLEIIKTNWIVLLGLLLVVPYIIQYYKDANAKSKREEAEAKLKLEQAQNQNPTTQASALHLITSRQDLIDITKNVIIHLGVVETQDISEWFGWTNYSTWSENDDEVYKQLVKVKQASSKQIIIKLYYSLTGRNLENDIRKYLDKAELNKLPMWK